MAGIITIAKGHDASYPWKQIGAAEPGKPTRNADKGVGYYLSPAEKGGEPPGTWTGKGVAELGLRQGAIVDRQVSSASTASISIPATRPARPASAGPQAVTRQPSSFTPRCSPPSQKPPPNVAPSC
jgi:hypothetical protein